MVQDDKAEMIKRLKRIEGQVRGVQRMVEQDRDCTEILHQLSAINEAVRSVSRMVVEEYALACLQVTSKKGKSRATIASMLKVISRAPR